MKNILHVVTRNTVYYTPHPCPCPPPIVIAAAIMEIGILGIWMYKREEIMKSKNILGMNSVLGIHLIGYILGLTSF